MIRQRSEGRYTFSRKKSAWRVRRPNRATSSRRPLVVEFRKVLIVETNADTWAAIMDDNPGEFSNQINGTYPEDKPLSTVPPNILAVLPRLPDDIQYRFLGRHLILLDTRANVILDRIPCAIERADRDELTCHR